MSRVQKYAKSEMVTVTSVRGSEYQIPKELKDLSISQIIRALTSDGWSRAQISKVTGIRYQHVRNVLLNPIKSKK